MKIALVSDAWAPQVNGVVRTLTTTVAMLRARGDIIETITPDGFATLRCPGYPEIRLALGSGKAVARRLTGFAPEAVHIATEGPLGWAARRWCLAMGMPFTTSFHTRFPDYLALRTRLPAGLFWPVVQRFHAPAARVFAATQALEEELHSRGLPRTHRWSRGVDTTLFRPDRAPLAKIADLPRPILLHVGRVAIEKNIEAFLSADVAGSKVVVGDGPALAALRERYPAAHFLGALHGEALASAYAAADLLVFPSLTDTFGLVMIEALASGVPVAAHFAPGALDIIGRDGTGGGTARIGALADTLSDAITQALGADRAACVAMGQRYTWEACTEQFVSGLMPVRAARARA
jgi:glycosyltransferase involved in cell wall biosynthesis